MNIQGFKYTERLLNSLLLDIVLCFGHFLFSSLVAFDLLDLLGAEEQHAVLEAAHLTRGGCARTRGYSCLPVSDRAVEANTGWSHRNYKK